ncbi:MAG: substrate-binding domain-containing protein [Planctomycetota bacterium]
MPQARAAPKRVQPAIAPTQPTAHVGIFVQTWHTAGRDILRGITYQTRDRHHWDIHCPWPGYGKLLLDPTIRLDAAILRWDDDDRRELHRFLQQRRHPYPVVLIGDEAALGMPPDLGWDQVSVGRLAAEHLLEHAHQTLAYVGHPGRSYQARRWEGFRAACPQPPQVFEVRDESPTRLRRRLLRWLPSLPRPTGLFAATDPLARAVLDAAKDLGIGVPNQLALIGAGDDELLCELVSPALSSIGLPGFELGQQAALRLETLLQHPDRQRPKTTLIPARAAAARRSTDDFALDDPAVLRALRYIRDHADRLHDLRDIVAASKVSRRTLEKRLKATTGHTLQTAVYNAQLKQAQSLLATTNLSITHVALRCGFPNPQRFSEVFKRTHKLTASAYRHRYRRA